MRDHLGHLVLGDGPLISNGAFVLQMGRATVPDGRFEDTVTSRKTKSGAASRLDGWGVFSPDIAEQNFPFLRKSISFGTTRLGRHRGTRMGGVGHGFLHWNLSGCLIGTHRLFAVQSRP